MACRGGLRRGVLAGWRIRHLLCRVCDLAKRLLITACSVEPPIDTGGCPGPTFHEQAERGRLRLKPPDPQVKACGYSGSVPPGP